MTELTPAQVESDKLDKELAILLLEEWFDWCRKYRPALGAPRLAPYCRQFRSSRQYDDEAAYAGLHVKKCESVDWCVGTLAVPMQQAIGAEMRNRQVKVKVWQMPQGVTFQDALEAVIPKMRDRGLLD
jgi:hypothetical protein